MENNIIDEIEKRLESFGYIADSPLLTYSLSFIISFEPALISISGDIKSLIVCSSLANFPSVAETIFLYESLHG